MKKAKPSTGESNEISWKRETPCGASATSASRTHTAMKTPNAPPSSAMKKLSTRSCRTIWPRLAPTATRMANSRARAAPRAANRLARFAQAMSNTNPTAPSSRPRFVRYFPTRFSRSGVTTAPTCALVAGYSFSSRAAMPFISARA